MTGFFNSRSGSSVRNYYYYVPSDKKLHDIGLASYTRNSLDKFGKKRKDGRDQNDPDISEYLSGGIDSIKPILRGDSAELFIYRFEKDTKRYLYTTKSGADENNIFWTPSGTTGSTGGIVFTDLKSFQDKFDLFQKGWIKDNGSLESYNIKYIWSKINNSLSGCINFNINGYSILNQPSNGVVSLFLQSKGDGNDRSVAFQPPVIAGVGRTATGVEHAFNLSENLGPGAFSAPDVGGIKNPNNTVAGPLKMHFNRGTGEWESGTTQTYCKILDDIPGVSLADLPLDVDGVSNESLNTPFNSGMAMVISTEKGNPHLLVPCSTGCITSDKEKIVVLNRSPRSYVKGEICLASQINGDWVPVPLTNGLSVAKKLTIEWSQIQKYITNAKGFFRDFDDTSFLEPDNYQSHVRSRFYDSLPKTSFSDNTAGNNLSTLRLINLGFTGLNDSSSIIYSLNNNGSINMTDINDATTANSIIYLNRFPSLNFIQFYDADIIPKNLGGNNAGPNRLKNTVIKRTEPSDADTGVAAESVPVSWGMYFPDGYISAGVTRTKSVTAATSANPSMKIYDPASISFSSYTNTVQVDNLNLKDAYFYHMPAQIALNSSRNQTIELSKLVLSMFSAGVYCDNLINYMNSSVKGDWIKAGSRDMYGLTPVNSTSIQFTPLSLELALSSTMIYNEGLGSLTATAGGYKNLKENLLKIGAGTEEHFKSVKEKKGFFGGAFPRIEMNTPAALESDGSVYGYISFGRRLYNINAGTDFASTIGPPKRGDAPDGGPDLLPNAGHSEASNVMGIIGTKGTFSLPNGGSIELKTSNMFGLLAYTQNILAGTSYSFQLFVGAVLDLSGKSREVQRVQWGGSLGDEQIKEFGSTALWCAVYDHCPNTIYDSRYFTPLQFNPSDASVDFDEVNLSPGTQVQSQRNIQTRKNKIRRGMLISNGGFTYIKRIIAADISSVVIEKAGAGYAVGSSLTFALGDKPAEFVISEVDGNGGILAITLNDKKEGLSNPVDAYGQTSNNGTVNPFYSAPLYAQLPINTFPDDPTKTASIKMTRGRVIEKLMTDMVKFYGAKKVTPSDNNGKGNNRGFVTGSKTTTFSVSKNDTGKYDIFLFFANDILNYPEAGVAFWEGYPVPPARYVNLEITSI
jgi:hypothetical protein